MKLLLVYPHDREIVRTSSPMAVDRHTGLFPPLNLLYIASYINATGRHRVQIVDMPSEGNGALALRLSAFKPDIVGISAVSFNLLSALDAARSVKAAGPHIKVVIGGPHAAVYPAETASYDAVDFAVTGEGEVTALKLLDAIEAGGGYDAVPGLAYRSASGVVNTGQAPLIENLDALPFPDRRLVPFRKHFNILSQRLPSTTMFSGRGCGYDCSFCYHSFGRTVRLRSASNVADEMEMIRMLGIRDIYFVDDAFTASRKRVMQLCSELTRRGLDLQWAVRGRVDSVNPELLKAMRNAGCTRIHYGVESANQKTLDRVNKKTDLETVQRAFRWTRRSGILSGAELMLGGPGETRSDIENTIEFTFDLAPDFAFFNITTPYPGTKLYREGLESGVFASDFWGEFASSPSRQVRIRCWDEHVSETELDSFLREAHSRFYFRPSYVARILLRTRSPLMFLKSARIALEMGSYALLGKQ